MKNQAEAILEMAVKATSDSVVKPLALKYPSIPQVDIEEFYDNACLAAWIKLQTDYFDGEPTDTKPKHEKVAGFIFINTEYQCRDKVRPGGKKRFTMSLDTEQGTRTLSSLNLNEYSKERDIIHKEAVELVVSTIASSKNEKWMIIVDLKLGVVSSFWIVDDRSTKHLFKHFYNALNHKEIDEYNALRNAMKIVRQMQNYSTFRTMRSFSLLQSAAIFRQCSASSVLTHRTMPPIPFSKNFLAIFVPEPDVFPLPVSPRMQQPSKLSLMLQ